MDDCIFCKIANGEMGSLIFENELAAAFLDLNPQAPVHVLIVPKKHYAHIIDGVDPASLEAMIDCVHAVAKEYSLDESGFRIIMNTGEDAGQTVHHLHMHLLGGKSLGEGLIP